MKTFLYKKLVRDKIALHMQEDGQIINGLKELNDTEFIQELQKKVLEEAQELAAATSPEELKEELADVMEVLAYLQSTLQMKDAEVLSHRQKKAAKNGAFDKRVYIESISLSENDPWYGLSHEPS